MNQRAAMTIIEILVVIFVLFLLAGLLLPLFSHPRTPARRIACVNNLKQVALGFRIWSSENGGRFPWAVSETNASPGTLEYAGSRQSWRHFAIVSNEIAWPRVFACPSDAGRIRATDWQDFTSNDHLSYFAGLDADETKPPTILAGDRNVRSTVKTTNGILRISADAPIEWTPDIHKLQGNIALGDGSVQQATINSLQKQFEAALSVSTNQLFIRLAIPE